MRYGHHTRSFTLFNHTHTHTHTLNKLVPAISKHLNVHYLLFICEWTTATDNDTTISKFLIRKLVLYLFLIWMMYTLFEFHILQRMSTTIIINCGNSFFFSVFNLIFGVINNKLIRQEQEECMPQWILRRILQVRPQHLRLGCNRSQQSSLGRLHVQSSYDWAS